VIREEVTERQSKLLSGTWPIFQFRSNASLFYHFQDQLAIEELTVLGTQLEN
jgi:hypothetical protein